MLDTVKGIMVMRKLMDWGLPKNLVQVDEAYFNGINYYHDAWYDVTLLKQKIQAK